MAEIALNQKRRRINAVSIPAEVAINIVMILFCALCIVPFILVIIISFSAEDSIRAIGYSFLPQAWSVAAYEYAFKLGDALWRSYFNSFYITVLGTILSLIVYILYSYALSRKDFKYRNLFTFINFFVMLFGGGLVPTYCVTKQLLGLSDSYWAIIIPMLLNPFNVIVLRTFFQSSVPDELIEAASIDGSGEYNTLFKIVVPVAKPGIATIGLLTAIAYWNEWFIPKLYISASDKLHVPLQYLLMKMQADAEYIAKNSAAMGAEAGMAMMNLPTQSLRMVLVVLVVFPIACAYPFFQRYIISGLTIGSVKG